MSIFANNQEPTVVPAEVDPELTEDDYTKAEEPDFGDDA